MQNRPKLEVKFLNQNAAIPRELLEGFIRDTPGANKEYVKEHASPEMKGRTGIMKVGIFDGKKMVGFATANIFEGATSIYTAYVMPQYRKKGCFAKMAGMIRDETERRGGRKVWWVKLSPSTEDIFWHWKFLSERKRNRKADKYTYVEGEPGCSSDGLIELKAKTAKKSPLKTARNPRRQIK